VGVAKISALTHAEVLRRIEFLKDFHGHVVKYFQNLECDYLDKPCENEVSAKERTWINLHCSRAKSIMRETGTVPIFTWTSPPAMGYITTRDLDVLNNIFLLHEYRITPKLLIDVIENAIGRYKEELPRSLFRTWNPFWWLGKVLGWILSIPISILGVAGFETDTLEQHILTKLFKTLWALIVVFGTVLPILELIGYTDLLRDSLRGIGFLVR